MVELGATFGTESNRSLLAVAFGGAHLNASQAHAFKTLRAKVRKDPAIKVLIAEGKELKEDVPN